MARLRKPSPDEPATFMSASTTKATRSSPRKPMRPLQYAASSDEENTGSLLKIASRGLRNTNLSSQDAEESFLIPKTFTASDALTPRKQRILRTVESNSRLLRKLSDESLASPEKKRRERRVRSGTTDTDVGKKTNLLYAKTLAKSMVKKKESRSKIDVLGKGELREPVERPSREDTRNEVLEVEEEQREAQTSLWCGDEEKDPHAKRDIAVAETSDEEEDPVISVRQRRQWAQTRRAQSPSDDESEESIPEDVICKRNSDYVDPKCTQQKSITKETQPLTSMRPPHKKGHSTISNWAQEVIDLTSSPDPPTMLVLPPLPPPTRIRTASFASSRPQTSSSNGGHAILTYSPTPTKLRSPCKAPPVTRPITPPLAPLSPNKLVSPSKKKPTIPKAPNLRPSLDAFWDPEVVNGWNELHSPSKPLVSPKKQKWREEVVQMMEGIALKEDDSNNSDIEILSPTSSPRKLKVATDTQLRSPTKKPVQTLPPLDLSVKDVRAQRKAFAEQKHAIASSFLTELDTTISQGRISLLTQQTGGIKLVWSRTLKTTAGRANWRREQIRIRTGPLPTDFTTEIRHHCSIDLAEKVIDDEERLYNVLAHEFCHLTTFMLSNVRNNPHGAEFKSWGRQATSAFAHKGVEVTTKHSYSIDYKFVWECVNCGYEFKRHSKSVDTSRHSCGRCKGKLVQTKPTPRAAGKDVSEYQVFVKANFARVKKEMESNGQSSQMGKVMEAVARDYREMKAAKATKDSAGLEDALKGLKI
jgi:predicted SprT family Zn-dependent metalloprotease